MVPRVAAPAVNTTVLVERDDSVGFVRSAGTTGSLHLADPFTDPLIASLLDDRADLVVRLCSPTDSALVLGSRQTDQLVDITALDARGIGLVRRRSGGGAVLIVPDDVVWIEFVARPGSWFPDDVRGSMVAAGRLWLAALGDAGLGSDAGIELHDGGMRHAPWSDLVCFAGLGPGELHRAGHKLVGLSQRRTRHGVRISAAMHRRDLVAATAALLAPPVPPEVPPRALTMTDVGLADIVDEAVIDALVTRARRS